MVRFRGLWPAEVTYGLPWFMLFVPSANRSSRRSTRAAKVVHIPRAGRGSSIISGWFARESLPAFRTAITSPATEDCHGALDGREATKQMRPPD